MSKIKQSDLRVKLGLGESKRVSEGNGLTLIITGTQKGTTFKFQHRCTLDGKRIEKILKTKDLDEARLIAAERMSKVANGIHPDKHAVNALTVNAVAEEWLSQKKDRSASTIRHQAGYIRKIKERFDSVPVSELKEKQVYDFISSIFEKTPISAKKILCVIRSVLHYARIVYKLQIPDLSGMQNLFKAPPVKHRASLTEGNLEDNIISIFLAVKNNTFSRGMRHIDFIYLSFMLLLRRDEVGYIKKKNINFSDRVLFIEKTKNLKDGFRVPITDELERVLKCIMKKSRGAYLFTSTDPRSQTGVYNSSLVAAKLSQTVEGQSFHGIRSIGRLWMHQNGIPFEVAESCLTHVVGSAVTRAYLRTDYFEERRQAMEKWHNYLHNLLKDIVTFE